MARYIIDTDNPDEAAIEAVLAWLKRREREQSLRHWRVVRASSGRVVHVVNLAKRMTLCGYPVGVSWIGAPRSAGAAARLRNWACPNCTAVAEAEGQPGAILSLPWATKHEIRWWNQQGENDG